MTDLVLTQSNDGVGELILNRPERRNSLTGPLVQEMKAKLQVLAEDDTCHAIMIRGNEGYFCAGLDLKAFAEEPAPPWRARFQDDWAALHTSVYECDKPIIGALEGFAIAGGSALAFACDYLVAGENAFLHVAEVERGLGAPINMAWLTVRYDYARALQLAVIGERHYGERLVALGLAVQCVPDDQVVEEARKLAGRLAGFNPSAVQHLKRTLRRVNRSEDFEALLAEIKSD